MQNVPVGNSSPSGNAGYVSHTATTVPATHQIQPATSLGQQPGNNAYFSSVQVVDPTAAFPFNIDPVNQNLPGYPTAMAPPPAINNFDPSQLALRLDAYQPQVEFPEHFFVNHQPMAPLPEAAAGQPALAHGTDRGLRQQPPSMT
ncbi:ankyrin repeats (many copies) family protein [Aspergillus tubingensis]|uniref:ankyrin repeats (many copies) family protein n=1 Tax=Aspergillus tubingensis TaxID=5068 RepID=UPI0015781CC0|nr:ankyrin repeats (many copies) family protein [Aspergillus tubingensis]GFN13679.1 ankyrin repeats (many copies) family protein [Aspergillus tubingensis]